jgi:hypothetical protein
MGMPVQSVDVLQIRADLKKNLSQMPLERLREFRTRLDRLEEFEAERRYRRTETEMMSA